MENGLGDESLFDPKLLCDGLDWGARKCKFHGGVSPSSPGDNLILRPLQIADYDRGFIQLLSQLTGVGEVSKARFEERFQEMKSCCDTYYVVVLQDLNTQCIVGAASLIIEMKFIHSATRRGRIEDVVVDSEYRGRQLGKLLVETLTLLGKEVSCYKMSLECKEQNRTFYEGFGYKPDGQHFMVQRYDKG